MKIRYSRLCCNVDEGNYPLVMNREGFLRMKLSQKAWHLNINNILGTRELLYKNVCLGMYIFV